MLQAHFIQTSEGGTMSGMMLDGEDKEEEMDGQKHK